jgi:archaeal type IV pilus assembly protein PilA
MNVWGTNERSWRKARKRAVSPIIATILLVAITVVLAAVLYVLISGLTHGPGNTPIGSAFGVGNPSSATKCAVTTAGCLAANDYIYTLTIESSTVTFASVIFEVKSPTGAFASATGHGGFDIVSVSGNAVAAWNNSATVSLAMPGASAWVYPGTVVSGSTPLTTLYTLVIDMGSVNPAGQGYTLNAVGVGSYSGTTTPITLP